MNPSPAFEKFSDYLFKQPFSITGLNTTVQSNDNLWLPLLYELGIKDPMHFHVIDWHQRFDALIGSEDLRKLGAKIDYTNNTLQIHNKKIPFLFEYNSKKIKPEKVSVHNVVKIPVSIDTGDVIFPEISLNKKIKIPESIVTAVNGYCTIPLSEEVNLELNFNERIPVTPLWDVNIENPPVIRQKKNISNFIRTSHLNSEEKSEITNVCRKFQDVFYDEESDLTFSNAIKHEIRTTDDSPIYVKPFRHPHAMKEQIQIQVQKLLDNKIIRPSISPYSAPVWIVPKKVDSSGEKKYRMVIDFRKLNEKTIEDKYPIPRIEEILDNLGKSSYFTTLDLAQGFHQIELHPNSIEKTGFSVNNGHYEYVRMPFGLKNAPSTFQRVMDNIFREFINKFVFIYMDDLIIFSKSLNEHIQHLTLIFKKLREFNLKIQPDKSEFLRKDVEFLGHIITPSGIKPNPSKLKAIEKFPIPKTPKEIKSFLGLVGYYRRFISNFSKIVSPLTKCLKKGSKLNFNDPEYIYAFNHCKEILMNAPVLAYPDFSKKFKLTTDASNVAVGAVLSQSDRPIAYHSRTLNSAERNYSTIEKELLAILDSVKRFRPYLYGKKFTIETDHKPLAWLYKIKEPNSRLIRWRLKLEEFDFEVIYKKGKDNVVADALSRIEINNNENEENESVIPNIDEIPDPLSIDLDEFLTDFENLQNPKLEEIPQNVLDELKEYINIGTQQQSPISDLEDYRPSVNVTIHPSRNITPVDNIPEPNELTPRAGNATTNNEDLETIHSAVDNDCPNIPISEKPLNHFQNRLVVKLGDTSRHQFRKYFNKNHHLVIIKRNAIEESISEFMRDIFVPNLTYGIYFVEEEIKEPFLRLFRNTFNRSIKLVVCTILCKDILTPENQKELVNKYHDKTHNGINETYKQLKNKYFWPNMMNTITEMINSCEVCLQSKYERHPYNPKLQGPLLAKRPFDIVHIDTFTFQNSKFLTIIDLFSRYAQAYLLRDGTALTILNKLRHYISHHNIPQKLVCDKGREFDNKTFIEFCKLHKIDLHFTTVDNPNSNSPVERFHSTLLEKLRILKIKNPGELPSNLVISAILIYNQAIHSSTGFSPFHLLYGPYDRLIEFDLDLTIFERYNEKRREELLPFYDNVFRKNENKAKQILEKRNENRDNPPQLENKEIFVKRNRPRKTDPPFEKIRVVEQDNNKITGLTEKNRPTTAHLLKVKKLRNVPSSFQENGNPSNPDSPQPGPSCYQN